MPECSSAVCFATTETVKGGKMHFMGSLIRRLGLLLAVSLLCLFPSTSAVAGEDEGGAVFALTNQSTDNTVVVFGRAANGTLVRRQEVSTHGLGSGAGLGSQGALTLNGHLLFAVNAGSNELSVLRVSGDGLHFVGKVASGGVDPISVTVHEDIVYVLNAGGTPSVTGFYLGRSGELHPIPNSTHTLAGANAQPAQVGFSPKGDLLLVTEKNNNLIDVFQVDDEGLVENASSLPSNNATPFGFSFGPPLIVSEAAAGAPGASTLSSYGVSDNDTLETISKSVPDTQAAACWVVITRNGHLAFTSNTASGTVSSFRVSRCGVLSLIAGVAADLGTDSAPTDMALSGNSRFLYVLNSGAGTVAGFRVRGDGNLTAVNEVAGLPLSAEGLAAR